MRLSRPAATLNRERLPVLAEFASAEQIAAAERLLAQAGVSGCELLYVDSSAVNAAVFNGKEETPAIAVYRGLLKLDPDVFSWVIAHEIGHIIDGPPVRMSKERWAVVWITHALTPLLYVVGQTASSPVLGLVASLLACVAIAIEGVAINGHTRLMREGEYRADAYAVELTGIALPSERMPFGGPPWAAGAERLFERAVDAPALRHVLQVLMTHPTSRRRAEAAAAVRARLVNKAALAL